MAAKNYTEILALVNAGNQMGLSNTIKRDYGIPLDFTSVQPSYDDAVIYAAENTKAYVGQPLSVGGKLYIINDVAAETKHTVGEKEYDNYLVEVGSATEGDGVSIDLEAGVLTLHGFEGALSGYLPRKSEDGELEWVPISAVVQGDGNKVTTLTSADGSVSITKTTDTDESLVYDLSVVHPAAPEYAIAADERAEDATSTTYHLTKDGENVDVAIVVPDAYDDTDLAGRVKAIEDDYLTEDDKYDDTALAQRVTDLENAGYQTADDVASALAPYATTQSVTDGLATKADKTAYEATVEALEALQARVEAFLDNTGAATEAIDTLQELLTYIDEHDDVDIEGILADIQALDTKLKLGTFENAEGEMQEYATVEDYVTAEIQLLNLHDYAKTTDVENAIADAVAGKANADEVVSATDFETFKSENDAAIADARTGAVEDVAAVGYALESEVAETYATKQSVTDLGTAVDTKLNDYAKTADVDATYEKIGTAYTKAEVDAKIGTPGTPAVKDAEGNEITPAVAGTGVYQHVYSKSEVTDLIADITGGESAADVKAELKEYKTTNDTRVKAVEDANAAQDTAIAKAQADATQGINDAAAAKAAADAAQAQANTNKTDIGTILSRLGAVEGTTGEHATLISTLDGKVTGLLAEDVKINEAIGALQANVTTLTGEDARLAGLIAGNTTEIGKKANAADVYSKDEVNATVAGINEELAKKLVAADLADYAKSADVAATYSTIAALEAIYKAGEGEAAATGILAEEIARAKAAEQKIADELALLINNPTKELDSVLELIEHVTEHGTAVAGIITRLDGHDTALENLEGRIEDLEDKPEYTLPAATAETLGGVKSAADVDGKVVANKVYVDATSNVGEVKALSTDVIINGVEEFILNGGNASGAAAQ